MASCDDDFGLLGDDHQQLSSLPFSHHHQQRYNISTTKGASNNNTNDCESAFAQSDINNHCFAAEDTSAFAPQSRSQDEEEEDEDEDDDDDNNRGGGGGGDPRSSHGGIVRHHQIISSSSRHHHLDPKRKDPPHLSSDGAESPSSIYYAAANTSSSSKKPRTNNNLMGVPAAATTTTTSSMDYRKDREEWSDTAIACLLDAYTEKYIQLNRGNLRGRDWEDVATIVSERSEKHKSGKSVEQCKNKVDNLKKRYKVECHRLTSGSLAVSHWPWFKKMEQIVGSSSSSSSKAATALTDDDKASPLGDGVGGGGVTSSSRQIKRYQLASPSSAGLGNNFRIKSVSSPRWKRALLKISGAALAGTGPHNVDPEVILLIAREVAIASRVGVEVAIVVGGRNFFCGDTWVAATATDRAAAYQIGMMASAMNALLLQASLEKNGVDTRVQTAFMMQEIAEPYIRRRAIRHLEKGRVVIFSGSDAGIGNPLLTTDTAAALRASEINADILLKGTNMDHGYECHSRTTNAEFEHISFKEISSRNFSAMDMTAITFCAENNIPVIFFNFLEPGNISRALCGDQVGTLIDQSGRIS